VLPLKDNVVTPGIPVVTVAVIIASAAIYIAGWEPELAATAWPWAALASLLLSASMLARGINMLFLWLFAESLEGLFGPVSLALLLVGAGLVAAGAEELVGPETTVPSVGIAGPVAGLIGAYALTLPHARIVCWVLIPFFVTFVEIPALVLAAVWLALQAIPEVGQPPVVGLAAGLGAGLAGGWLLGRGRPALVAETEGVAR
jgi:membrane associated rhomboid family serine protease